MCLIFFFLVFEAEKKKKKFYYVGLRGLGLAGGQDRQGARTSVSVSVKWWDSPPPSGDLEPANQCAPSKKPAPFAPIELL